MRIVQGSTQEKDNDFENNKDKGKNDNGQIVHHTYVPKQIWVEKAVKVTQTEKKQKTFAVRGPPRSQRNQLKTRSRSSWSELV